jgi:hypothetical protein
MGTLELLSMVKKSKSRLMSQSRVLARAACALVFPMLFLSTGSSAVVLVQYVHQPLELVHLKYSSSSSQELTNLSQPCTLRDFMNYLKYIEHAAENLQFYLWLRQYTEKFNALPDSERALAPEWKMTQAESDKLVSETTRTMKISADTVAALKGTGLDSTPKIAESEKPNPFGTPERTPSEESDRTPPMSMVGSEDARSGWMSTFSGNTDDTRKRAADAYGEAGLKWKPCKLCIKLITAVMVPNTATSHHPTFP